MSLGVLDHSTPKTPLQVYPRAERGGEGCVSPGWGAAGMGPLDPGGFGGLLQQRGVR